MVVPDASTELVVVAGRTPPPVDALVRRAAGDWFPGRVETDLERFAGDFAEAIGRISRPGEAEALARSSGALHNEVAMSPRDAFLGRTEVVPIADAEGRVSSESIAGYPPGIPALLPGERVTREAIEYLHELVGAGARLHGAADPELRSIYVVCD